MAATDIHFDFHNGTPASEPGITTNAAAGASAGVIFADALQEDGSASGVSLSVATGLTADSSGRSAGSPQLVAEINAQGSYSSANTQTFTLTFPASVTSVDLRFCATTTYGSQSAVDYTAVGANTVSQSAWNQTNNTAGSTFTLSGCQPDGSNQIVVTIDNPGGIGFIFHNGFSVLNIQSPQTRTASGALAASPASINATFGNAPVSASGSLAAAAASVSASVNVSTPGGSAQDVYVSFYRTTPTTESGEVLNTFTALAANTPQSLNDRTGADSGFTLESNRAHVVPTEARGRTAGANSLLQAINAEGNYSDSGGTPGSDEITLACPANLSSCTIVVPLCTTYTAQDSLTVTVNPGQASEQVQAGWDSSGNTTGAVVTFNNVVPEAGEIVIRVVNTPNRYIFHNGLLIQDIVVAGGEYAIQAGPASISATVNVTGTPQTISASGALAASPASIAATMATPTTVSDTFDGSGAVGSHWLEYNPRSAPVSPVRDGGYWRADITDNTGDITTWWQLDKGQLHYQPVRFPTGATPNEYHFYGVGVGPNTASFRDNLPYGSGDYAFCGPLVGLPEDDNWMFSVAGHRGGSAQFTIENKSTNGGSSSQNDEGSNVVGVGVSFVDFGVELHSNGDVLFKYRAVGGGSWTYINGGSGYTPGTRPNVGSNGSVVWLGMVAYAFGTSSVPFTGSIDSFQVITEEAVTETQSASGSLAAAPASLSASVSVSSPATRSASGSLASDPASVSASVSVTGAPQTRTASGSLAAGAASVSASINVSGQVFSLSGAIASGAASIAGSANSIPAGSVWASGSLAAAQASVAASLTVTPNVDASTFWDFLPPPDRVLRFDE